MPTIAPALVALTEPAGSAGPAASPSGSAPALRSFAIPKSSTFTKSSPERVCVSITFPGFTSRWTIPASCASASEPRICWPISATRRSGSGPASRSTVARSFPATYSIAR